MSQELEPVPAPISVSAGAGRQQTDNPPTFPEGIERIDEQTPATIANMPELLIITGMSGAGRSRAGQCLEDLDWYVVDNLPPTMLIPFSDMITSQGEGVHRLAAVVDARSRAFFHRLVEVLDELEKRSIHYRVIFLDADNLSLVRRYESNRRPHPLQGEGRILDGIKQERELLKDIRQRADIVIDTTNMNVHDLSRHMRDFVAGESDRPVKLTFMSFGFKYGTPVDADWVIDARFLANPYWVDELRNLTGVDKPVSDYVLRQKGVDTFVSHLDGILNQVILGYRTELKPFATVAIGCTGGKHRSVALTEKMASIFRGRGLPVRVVHRDMGKE